MLLSSFIPVIALVAILGFYIIRFQSLNLFAHQILLLVGVFFICVAPQWGEFRAVVEEVNPTQLNVFFGLGIIALFAGLNAFGRDDPRFKFKTSDVIIDSIPIGPGFVATLAGCFIAATGVVTIEAVKSAQVGFWQYFFGERLSIYLENTTQQSMAASGAYFVMIAVRPVLLIVMCALWLKKRWALGWAIYAILLGGVLCIFRTRLEVMIMFGIPVVFWHYFRRGIRFWQMAVLFAGFIFLQAVLNLWRGVGVANVSVSEMGQYATASFGKDLNPISSYVRVWDLNERGILPRENGLNYYYTILTFIPRGLWPAKPITSLEMRWTAALGEDTRNGIHVFTIFGEGLIQFGKLGIILNCFLYGSVIAIVRRLVLRGPVVLLAWTYYAVLAATYARAGIQSLVFLSVAYWSLVLAIQTLWPRGRNEGRRSPTLVKERAAK